MTDKIAVLNSRIRMQFDTYGKPIDSKAFWWDKARDLFNSRGIYDEALKVLITSSKVKVVNGVILPVDNEGIVRSLCGQDENHVVRRELILRVLEVKGDGITSEKITEFYKDIIDGKVKGPSVDRIVRFMFAEGSLRKEGTLYYLASTASKSLSDF